MTISLSFYLPDGWGSSREWFSSMYDRKVGQNKHFEWQTGYFGWTTILSLDLNLIPTGGDHARIGFEITIFGFMISAQIYDTRHWNRDTNSWAVYTEESYQTNHEAELDHARKLITRDIQHKAEQAQLAYLSSPEGLAEIAQQKAVAKEERRRRGEAYRAANLAANLAANMAEKDQ